MVVETQKQNMATLASSGVKLIGRLLVLFSTAAASNSPNNKNYLYKAIPVDHRSILSSLQDFGKVSFLECASHCLANDALGCNFFLYGDYGNGGSQCKMASVDSSHVLEATSSSSLESLVKFKMDHQCLVDASEETACTPSNIATVDEKAFSTVFSAMGGIYVNECEFDPPGNYWVSPGYSAGEDDAFFVLDLGCCRELTSVTLKNIKNAHHNDRTTVDFRLMLSIDTAYNRDSMIWVVVVKDSLTSALNKACADIPLDRFVFPKRIARFVKFVVDTYIGFGGGLKYINLE